MIAQHRVRANFLQIAAICALCASLASTPSAQTNFQKYTPQQLAEDFQIARRALEEGHSGIYRYTEKADLDRVFDAAARSLDRPMNGYEFFRVLAPAISAVKCGHTGVSLSKELEDNASNRALLLPMRVRVLGGKPYVFRDLSPGGTAAGKEIRSVNGVPAGRLVERMMAAAPGDGDVQSSRQLRIGGWNFSTMLYTLCGLSSPYRVVLRDEPNQKDQEVQLTGSQSSSMRKAWSTQFPQDQRKPGSGDLHYLDEGRIAQLTIRQFGGFADAELKKNIGDFIKESFGDMHSKGSKALIIDLRNNGGGADELGRLLLSYLIDKPFKYYDDLIVNKLSFDFLKYADEKGPIPENLAERRADGKYHTVSHPNWGMHQPAQPRFAGKVYILINGGSFSTTSEFLSHAHFHKLATFIGEESGGGYYGNSSGFMPLVTLPNTKFTLRVPLMTYYMAVSGNKASSHGVVPDYQVDYTIQDLLAGTDKEMELALKLARK